MKVYVLTVVDFVYNKATMRAFKTYKGADTYVRGILEYYQKEGFTISYDGINAMAGSQYVMKIMELDTKYDDWSGLSINKADYLN